MVSFKNSVARKHELGVHAHSMKKSRSSLPPARVGIKSPAAAEEGNGGASGSGAEVGAKSTSSNAGLTAAQQVLNSMAPSATLAGLGASDDGTVADWSRQPCPLALPSSKQVMLLEEDLAGTLARSAGSRALPTSGVLSSTRTTGTCLYKWKMGVYSNPPTNV